MDVLFEHTLPYFGLSTPSTPSPSSGHDASSPNYVGAVIFWTYIASALYFLTSILRTLLTLRKFAIHRGHAYNTTAVSLFSAAAALSFATLSHHMLQVLIQSYLSWASTSTAAAKLIAASTSATAVPTTVSTIVSSPGDFATALWAWSVSSSLFRDFALAITATPARWAWAQADLGATLVTAHWMGIAGRVGTNEVDAKGRLDVRARVTPVAKLWTFFALLQILPASLTLMLFMIALLLTPPPALVVGDGKQGGVGAGAGAGAGATAAEATDNSTVILLGKAGYWITSGLLYCFILVEATQPERRHMLIAIILLGRALLLLPAVLPFARLRMSDPDIHEVAGASKPHNSASKSKKSSNPGPESPKPTGDKATETRPKSSQEIIDGANPFQLVDLPLALLALSAWTVVHQAYWAVQEVEEGGSGLKALFAAVDEHPAVSALGYDAFFAVGALLAWLAFGSRVGGRSGR